MSLYQGTDDSCLCIEDSCLCKWVLMIHGGRPWRMNSPLLLFGRDVQNVGKLIRDTSRERVRCYHFDSHGKNWFACNWIDSVFLTKFRDSICVQSDAVNSSLKNLLLRTFNCLCPFSSFLILMEKMVCGQVRILVFLCHDTIVYFVILYFGIIKCSICFVMWQSCCLHVVFW